MRKKLLIRDLTLRDAQQSLFATRMTQAQVDRVLPLFKDANFYAMEVWGGAVPDSVMRFLKENPWDRIEKIKAGIGDSSRLTALTRGRNLFGYSPYPNEVIEGFNRNAIHSGIDIMRIFDALNDINNIKPTIEFVKKNGGIADCTVCYTVDPKFKSKRKIKALLQLKAIPHDIFTPDYFFKKALELETLGADMITIKDMAGLIPPNQSGKLIKRLKKELSIPINFHIHCTPGYGLASTLMAIINGVDSVDTSIMSFTGGTAAPAFEIIQLFAEKLGLDTGVNLDVIAEINKELKAIRHELAEFDGYKMFPITFDISKDELPPEVDNMFDMAITYAKANKENELVLLTQQIEKFFNFPEPNEMVKNAEIPGGMYTNLLIQLKVLKLEHLLPRVLELVPMVRIATGCPPLVTPICQIVVVQAVNCAIDEINGLPPYTTKSIQFVNLVKGSYGKTPQPIDPAFRMKIAGTIQEIPYDTKYNKKQENTVFPEYGFLKLAENEKDELLLELFPSVARDFLKKRVEQKYMDDIYVIEEEKRRKIEVEKALYAELSPDEKEKRLYYGLYNYGWISSKE
ncbi:MAG: carboxylase [Bacteroidales bacterium]